MTDAAIIDEAGGTRAVATGMRETIAAVKKWRVRGIPLPKRPKFQAFAAKQGVLLGEQWLWRPARKAASAPRRNP